MSIYTTVTNPTYSDPSNTGIDCLVQFDGRPSPLPFRATATDEMEYGREIYAACVNGDYGPIAPYVAPVAPTPPPATKQQLLDYTAAKMEAITNGGVTIDLGGGKHAQIDTSATGRANLTGLVVMAGLNPALSVTWYQSSGNITLSAAEFVTIGTDVIAWISSSYAAQSAVNAQINALTITTTAQIDAYAWPVNS